MIKFRGTRQELGEFNGGRLRTNHHDFFSHIDEPLLKKQLKIYERYYPELVDQVIATAEAAKVDTNCLLYEELASFVANQKRRITRPHGCTIFAVHENGKTYVGRNYDWLPAARDFFEQYQLDISGCYKYFAFSDEGVWYGHTGKNQRKMYAEDVINEHGLYIGLTFAYIDKWNYGLAPTHFLNLIAEKCSTTRQALNIFAKVPCAVPKNFLIADAKGDLAVVEHAATNYEVVRPETFLSKSEEKLQVGSTRGKTREIDTITETNLGKILVHTNHCLSPKLAEIDKIKIKNHSPDSFVRYEETMLLMKNQLPNFQFTDIWRILRNSHYVYNSDTIWSLALELSEQRFNIYCDTAQGQKQQKFEFK